MKISYILNNWTRVLSFVLLASIAATAIYSGALNALYIQLIGLGISETSYEPASINMQPGSTLLSILLLHPTEWKNFNTNYTIKKTPTKFSEIKFKVDNLLLETFFLDKIIYKFASLIFKTKNTNRKILVIMRIKFSDGSYKSLHAGIVLNKLRIVEYIQYCRDTLNFRGNDYLSQFAEEIIFNYFIIPEGREKYFADKWQELKKPAQNVLSKFESLPEGLQLPLDRNYRKWSIEGHSIFVLNDRVEINNTTTGNTVISFTDRDYEGDTLDIFVREFNNYQFYIKENESIVLKVKALPTKYLNPIKAQKKSPRKIIIFDLETILKNGIMVPFLISAYDGKNTFSFFNSDPLNTDFGVIFEKFLAKIQTRKYKNHQIYAHNLSNFDNVFILKYIAKLDGVEILRKDGKIISIKIKIRGGGRIFIKDSILLLPVSLKKLSETFLGDKPELQKSIEPVLAMQQEIEAHNFFVQTDLSHYGKDVVKYSEYKQWKEEIIKYCEQDCISLFNILTQFKDLIYDNFKVNIEQYPTVPSLAFAIFRTKFLNKKTIPLTHGKVYEFMSASFTGGSTEMYKPFGRNIKCLDVTSLYPSMMSKWDYGAGRIFEFDGDLTILPDWKQKYWIANVDVETKTNLYQPYLQIHHKTPSGIRTIAPNGSFNMNIHSQEYFNALKDYKFKINRGYYFEKRVNLFEMFVNLLYQLRIKYPKGHPLNLIAKLLLNSLYGRFAMKPIITTQVIVGEKAFNKLLENFKVVEQIEFTDNPANKKYLVEYVNPKLDPEEAKVSVGISAGVTAYGRVFMSQFKNNPKVNLFYTDTDSIFTDSDLDKDLLGNELGKFKLEYEFKEVVFAGPKIYAGVTTDGYYICKVKGFKDSNSIPFEDMKSLLYKDKTLELSHDKWFRSLSEGTIEIRNQVYLLSATTNKREFVLDEHNKIVDTKAIKLTPRSGIPIT